MSKKNYSWLNLSYLNKSYKGLPFLHPKNLKDLYPIHKQRKDRAFKSWCNRDIWNFDGWFQQVIPEMLEELANDYGIRSKKECIMIGDASGKPGDFSDSDKKCAENFGIDYIDVRDFLEL